jgi:tetraacyldisaccharide 4'-kinase
MEPLLGVGAALWAAGWEARRRLYARGWRVPLHVPARVVSVGNLTVGGTGKTTLTLHLARKALERGIDAAVACRRYRPGPGSKGDEELLFERGLGPDRVFAGSRKRELAARAAALGKRLVIVDDGFSHWSLARDLDIVVLDAQDPWGGGRLLPAGRMREPRRALQRARVLVISRLEPGVDPAPLMDEASRYAPAARMAAGRHRITGVRGLTGEPRPARGAAVVVTGTGHPRAVLRTAREAGFDPVRLSPHRDHHWFRPAEAARERADARERGETVVLTAKDAVRWPEAAAGDDVAVLEVEWEWVEGGEAVERLTFAGE